MDDQDKHGRYANIPIPTYDEATSSRPSSSQNLRGPEEVSDDAERQGLLPSESAYRPPTVETPRSSEDSDLRLPEVDGEDISRRRIEELDYLDPSDADPTHSRLYHRARLRSKLSQQLSSLGATLSSIRLPRFRSLYAPVSTDSSATAAASNTSSWYARSIPILPSIPDRYRMSAPTAARLCGLLTIGILVYALFILDVFPGHGRYMGERFDPESVRAYVQDHVDAGRMSEYLAHITSYDHVAGTEGDLYMAEWMRERWTEVGNLDNVAMQSYYVYLNYPTAQGREVNIVRPESKKWTAQLEEDKVEPLKQQTLAWLSGSKSGLVEGHLIYANAGSKEDFTWLHDQEIVLNGSVCLMRYDSTQREPSLQVKSAQEAGCAGALLYSDPSIDGAGKGPVWPDGPWRPDDSVQRGSVVLSTYIVGDPLTPGYASTLDTSIAAKDSIVGLMGLTSIPALPLSWRDASKMLDSLRGHGKEAPREWQSGGMKYFTGAAPKDGNDVPVVNVKNHNDENEKQQIWNLHGLIEGLEQPGKKIIVGNHRDAWCFGAVDPGSGSAVLMEMVHIFGMLRGLGWRPLRSIEFVSWDAHMIGSSEYVEDNIDTLLEDGVAYINVGAGVYGPDPVFRAAGSPAWRRALLHVLDRISVPGDNATLRQIWDERQTAFDGLDAAGDYVGFQHLAGTSSLDFGFHGAAHGYPVNSCYDSFEWMKRFGDPDFNWHRTLAQVWALLILEVADRPILPYDLRAYASTIEDDYLPKLQAFAQLKQWKDSGASLEALQVAAKELSGAADDFHRFEDIWTANVLGAGGMENNKFSRRRVEFNNRLANFERDLLDLPSTSNDAEAHGLPGREQFKHVLFGPEAGAYFPAIWYALEASDFDRAQTETAKVAAILSRAAGRLQGNEG